MVAGPSIVFTREAVVDHSNIRKSTNVGKAIVGIDASQHCPYSMRQPMPPVLYTRYDFDADLQRFKPRPNEKIRMFRKHGHVVF